MINSSKIALKRDLRVEKELEAHIFRIRSTHQYYKLVQYEVQTHSHVRDRADVLIWTRVQLTNRVPRIVTVTYIFTWISQTLVSCNFLLRYSIENSLKTQNVSSVNCTKMKFYNNRWSFGLPTSALDPYENGPKCLRLAPTLARWIIF